MERATGIEPAYSAWEADVLPLNYIRRTMVLYRAAFDLSSKDLLFYRRARNLRRLLPFGTNICYTDSWNVHTIFADSAIFKIFYFSCNQTEKKLSL